MSLPRSVAEILGEHVTLDVEGIDRLYLNGCLPGLQYESGVAVFFRHCGHPLRSARGLYCWGRHAAMAARRAAAARRAGIVSAGTGALCAALLGIAALAFGCAGRPDLLRGHPPGADLAALVDSESARRLLADLLPRRSFDLSLTALAPSLERADLVQGPVPGPGWLPDQARLRELGREVSVDFAALAFARAIGADSGSRAVRAAFDRFLEDGADRSSERLSQPGAFPYTVLFAPSWLYLSHPETGADFAHMRRLLDRLGIANRLIATGESDSVEANASAIAAAVRAAGREGRPLILVSASKSGAEAALALSRLLAPKETASIDAWVNIAGALAGTPLADSGLRPPASWVARVIFWLNRWSWAGVTSMATGPSRARLEDARLPDWITVVNVVAVPMSGTLGYEVYWGYQVLRAHGPNDGVVLLADTVWPGGVNLVALGADHLLTYRNEDAPCLALLGAVDVAVRLHRAARERGLAVSHDSH